MTINHNSKAVWIGQFPSTSQAEEPDSNAIRVAKLVLLERYHDISGCNPSGAALNEMAILAKNAADDLDYVRDEKLLRKFLRKRITKLVNQWNLADWKRTRKSRGGETVEVHYGAALGQKLDRNKAALYNSQTGTRREADRIDSLKCHLLALLPAGKDKDRYEALVLYLDALDFDVTGNVAIGQHTTLRQTARDLTEIGIKTDHKALARLIEELRQLAKRKYTKPRISQSVIKQSYNVIKTSAEHATKNELGAMTSKPLFTLAGDKRQPPIKFPAGPGEPLVEIPLPHARIGRAVQGFGDYKTTKGRDVGPAAQALEEELQLLVATIPSRKREKREAALALSIWSRYHHHEPQNCKECELRIGRIRKLAGEWGNNLIPLSRLDTVA